jgi:hypothetical protein
MTPKDYEKAVLQRFRTLWPPPRFVVKHDVRLSGRKTKARRQVDVSIFETGKSQPSLIVEAKRHKRPIDAGIAGSTIARSGETGSFRKARTPESAIPKVSSVVATGRAIKGAETFMATPCRTDDRLGKPQGQKSFPPAGGLSQSGAPGRWRKPQIFAIARRTAAVTRLWALGRDDTMDEAGRATIETFDILRLMSAGIHAYGAAPFSHNKVFIIHRTVPPHSLSPFDLYIPKLLPAYQKCFWP